MRCSVPALELDEVAHRLPVLSLVVSDSDEDVVQRVERRLSRAVPDVFACVVSSKQ